jgi:hypothetical protein
MGSERLPFDRMLDGWIVTMRGMDIGICDGDDILWSLSARRPEQAKWCAGVARFRRGADGWRPISFVPVTPNDRSEEASLHRDIDGSLLMGARCAAHDEGDAVSHGLRVWRSTDNGQTWEQTISVARARASTPVVLNQAADATPYLAANPYRHAVHNAAGRKIGGWSYRQELYLWPLTADRRGLLNPIVARDTNRFDPPPEGRLWYLDHAMGNTVQLADGRWRHLLVYRGRISQPTGTDAEFPTPFTGCYIEEVATAGQTFPRWRWLDTCGVA